MLQSIFPAFGSSLMAGAILVSTFGCINGMVLSGSRAYYAMARDGLFFARAAVVNHARVPGSALSMQGLWSALLVLPRTYNPETKAYGNLYSDLLDYVISAALLFYILTIAGVFRLRSTQPDTLRPYRAFGYPLVPALYIVAAGAILGALVMYRASTTFPGIVIVALGVPVYFAFRSAIPAKAARQ